VNYWRVILATLVIYATGVVTGGLLVHYTAVRATVVRTGNRQPGVQTITPWQVRNWELMRRMQVELDLSPEQRTNISRILVASQERTRDLWRPIVPEMNREQQMVHREIRSELNPEQQQLFDDLIRQSRGPRHPNDAANPSGRNPAQANPAPAENTSTNTAGGAF
jgi:hypothetical protein